MTRCRWCGMESQDPYVCEWCKRVMATGAPAPPGYKPSQPVTLQRPDGDDTACIPHPTTVCYTERHHRDADGTHHTPCAVHSNGAHHANGTSHADGAARRAAPCADHHRSTTRTGAHPL
jgi:hypothetical protein